MGIFEGLKDQPEQQAGGGIFADMGQSHEDNMAVESAKSAVSMWYKLQKQGYGFWLDKYARGHAAVKGGVANLIKTATGDDEFEPITAIKEGWQSKNVPASEIVRPVMSRVEGLLPNIGKEATDVSRAAFAATPAGMIKKAGGIFKDLIPGANIAANALPDIPEEITPEQYIRGISQGAEVAVDVVTDPVLQALDMPYKVAKGVSKTIGLTEAIGSTIKRTLQKLPKGPVDDIVRYFTVTGGRDPRALRLLDQYYAAEQRALTQAGEVNKALSEGLSTQQKLKLGERYRGEVGPIEPELERIVAPIRKMFDKLSVESVKEGFLAEETFRETVGKYMPRRYLQHIKDKKTFVGVAKKLPTIKGERFMRRGDIAKETREAMGEILEPAFPVSTGLMQVKHDLNVRNLFKRIAKNEQWVKNVRTKGFTKLPQEKRWGVLQGRYVRRDLLTDMKEVVYLPSKFMKNYNRAMNLWKMAKILPNPSTHTRNLWSNVIMTDLSPSAKLHEIPKLLQRAGKEISDGGKYIKELKSAGAWNIDWASQEKILYREFTQGLGKDGVDILTSPQEFFSKKLLKKGKLAADEAMLQLGKLYSGEDNIFKMLHYIQAREKMGMGVARSIAYMRKWGLDFSRVSPAVNFLKRYTTPFITYTSKAVPNIIESAIMSPHRLYKWPVIFDAFERMSMRAQNMDDATLDAIRRQRSGYNILTPWKDEQGNPLFMDLTYILPWGDLTESGGLFGLPTSLTFSNPFVMIPMQIGMNKNIFMDQPIMTDEDPEGNLRWSKENVGAAFDFIYKAMMPTVVPGGYSWEKWQRMASPIPEHRKNRAGLEQEVDKTILDTVLGIKLRGVDVGSVMKRDHKQWNNWINDRKDRIKKIGMAKNLTEDEKNELILKEQSIMRDYMMRRVMEQSDK